MKRNYSFLSALLLALVLITTSCGKDKKDDDSLDFGASSVTMNVDGKAWKSMVASLITAPPEEDEQHYVVGIVATDMEYPENEDLSKAQGLTMYVAIPKSKFNSPIGEYKILNTDWGEGDLESGNQAMAVFIKTGAGTSDIQLYGPVGDGLAGSIKIEGFKIGKQPAWTGFEGNGYTELKGTFSMELTGMDKNENVVISETVKLANGKFNVKSGLSFGGSEIFMQFPKIQEPLKIR